MLPQVVGFDLVDDESKPERRPTKHMPTPDQWTNVFNPAFSYYIYYCYANLYTLNKVLAEDLFVNSIIKLFSFLINLFFGQLYQLRESKGMTIIKLRPHSGEVITCSFKILFL